MKMHIGLPVSVAALVGRTHERVKVADLVADARVVTLVGSGGCGKTRLAVEVAGDVASRFGDGARPGGSICMACASPPWSLPSSVLPWTSTSDPDRH